MDYQLIANILLAVSAFCSLATMLRWDLLCLQQNDNSNTQFMQWLQKVDESYSTKRIVAMAALVASATPWARQSWMVVAILAFVMIVLTVTTFSTKHEKTVVYNSRTLVIFITVLAVVAICAISLFTARFSLETGMMLILFTAFSYVLMLAANWLTSLFIKNKQ